MFTGRDYHILITPTNTTVQTLRVASLKWIGVPIGGRHMAFVNVSSPPNCSDLDCGRRPGDRESYRDRAARRTRRATGEATFRELRSVLGAAAGELRGGDRIGAVQASSVRASSTQTSSAQASSALCGRQKGGAASPARRGSQ